MALDPDVYPKNAEGHDRDESTTGQCHQRSERGERHGNVRATLARECDGKKLAGLANRMIRASEEEIAGSLQANRRDELLFLLRQEVE